MANAPSLTNAAASAAADAVVDQADTGYIRIYDGSKPANADTAVGAQTLLAELRFGATAFGAAANGVATANAITADSAANATGTATWFRVLASNGTTALWDGEVGPSGSDLNLSTTSIVANAEVSISALTYTQSKS
jgi:hypothetical protein